jgi:hypothetical protein
LSHQVSTLLNELQTLEQQIEKRDELLEYAKANCKKRFVPTLAKQHTALQQVPHPSDGTVRKRAAADWLYHGESNYDHGARLSGLAIEILQEASDDDDANEQEPGFLAHGRRNGSHGIAQSQISDVDANDSGHGSGSDDDTMVRT